MAKCDPAHKIVQVVRDIYDPQIEGLESKISESQKTISERIDKLIQDELHED